MNDEQDDVIETLLRGQFGGPVPDGGFSARVLQGLPRRRRRVAWPRWLGLAAGALAGGIALRGSPLLLAGWRDYVRGVWSLPVIAALAVILGMALLALAWGVSEIDDR